MNVFYPKVIAGTALFVMIGLFAGATIGMLFFIAMLPVAALFSDSGTGSQIALAVAALLGFGVAVVIVAFGTGAWKKRVQADYYRERGPRHVAPPPRSRPRTQPIPQRPQMHPQAYAVVPPHPPRRSPR